jgi:hypothetical protein
MLQMRPLPPVLVCDDGIQNETVDVQAFVVEQHKRQALIQCCWTLYQSSLQQLFLANAIPEGTAKRQ